MQATGLPPGRLQYVNTARTLLWVKGIFNSESHLTILCSIVHVAYTKTWQKSEHIAKNLAKQVIKLSSKIINSCTWHSQAWDFTLCFMACKQLRLTFLKWGRTKLGLDCEWGLGKTSGSFGWAERPSMMWPPLDFLASPPTIFIQSMLHYFLVLNNLFSLHTHYIHTNKGLCTCHARHWMFFPTCPRYEHLPIF